MNTPDTYIIIAGGGIGSRMRSAVPKQFLLLNDKPILQHTIERFQNCLPHAKITLVLPKFHIEIWQSMCKRFDYPMDYNIVEGGKERFFSIQNALNTLPPKGKVLTLSFTGCKSVVPKKLLAGFVPPFPVRFQALAEPLVFAQEVPL